MLLGAIAKYGIQDKACNWIPDFLLGTKQWVLINESYSKWATVGSEVIRGLVIGHVLFIFFINSSVNYFSLKIFLYDDAAKL